MPELFLKIYELFQRGENQKARQIQNEVCRIIYKMCSTGANLYGVMKELLRRSGIDVGSVRRPLRGVGAEDMLAVCEAEKMIRTAMDTYC
jgi:N-acetylneuraminate lyase